MKPLFLVICFLGLMANKQGYSQQLVTQLQWLEDNYQPEKLGMHLDKGIYAPGESIWFKAYLLQNNRLSDMSRNFYVDWYDAKGNLIQHTLFPVFESSAAGKFSIPANYVGNQITLKAYTNWSLNFDTAFIYTREIKLFQSKPEIPQPLKRKESIDLQFFPEGGHLVGGLLNHLAFKAINQLGKPASVKGAIFSKNNEFVDSFVTMHDGMGSLFLEPNINQAYLAQWVDQQGESHVTELPKVQTQGIALQVSVADSLFKFSISSTAMLPASFKEIHLLVTSQHQLVYQANANLLAKKSLSGQFSTKGFPSGIFLVTLFDEAWIPIAERIAFVNNQNYQFKPVLSFLNKRFQKRGQNDWEIVVPDTLLSNLSVSVTDANFSSPQERNIISDLLLTGDIHGEVYAPAQYFEKNAQPQHLDWVMLTNGWRKYPWEELLKGVLPNLKNAPDSDYLQIKGKLFTGGQASIKAGQTISLMLQGKDSTKKYFSASVKSDGSFFQRGLIFFDTAKLYYQLTGDSKLSALSSVSFNNGLPKIAFPQKISIPNFFSLSPTNQPELFYQHSGKLKRHWDSVSVLQEVTVTSKIKSPIDLLDEKYTTGIFSSRNGYAFDVANDDRAQGSIGIFQYLQDLIPGLSMSIPILGANGAEEANSNNVPGLNWREGTPDIFLNEMISDASGIMGIQMSDVAYIKVYRPPFMASAGSGPSGAIAVYTKKAADKKETNLSLQKALISGYTAYKEFYHPNYSLPDNKAPDTRSTLYWNPYLLTDKKNKIAKIQFYNNDVTSKFRIVIEGVNAAGKLARLEQLVE